jgi:hypothetical protein
VRNSPTLPVIQGISVVQRGPRGSWVEADPTKSVDMRALLTPSITLPLTIGQREFLKKCPVIKKKII